MRYFGSGITTHEICNYGILRLECNICNHESFLFCCNFSWNLQQWVIEVGVWYLKKSTTMRYFGSVVIYHDIWDHELFGFYTESGVIFWWSATRLIQSNHKAKKLIQINQINQKDCNSDWRITVQLCSIFLWTFPYWEVLQYQIVCFF